jgi:hypothetical protein
MATGNAVSLERVAKFKDAALVLAEDAVDLAAKLRRYVRSGNYERAEGLAAGLQRAARDCKWLMARQPRARDD